MFKAQLRNFKKNRIMVCFSLLLSVILSLSAPFSITSHATAIGIDLNSLDYLSSLYSLLLSGKMRMVQTTDPITGSYVDLDTIDDVTAFFDQANEYQDGLGDQLKSAVISGALDGSILLDEDLRKTYLDFLASTSGSVPVTRYEESYKLNSANFPTHIEIKYHTTSDPYVYTTTVDITSSSEYFLALVPVHSSTTYLSFFVIPRANLYPTVSITAQNTSTNRVYSYNSSYIEGTRKLHSYIDLYCQRSGVQYIYDSISVYTEFWPGMYRGFTKSELASMVSSIVEDGIASINTTNNATMADTENDVISTTSSVSETGEITGNFSIKVLPYDQVINILNGLNSSVLTLKDALRMLRLGIVSNTATVEEKESAIQTLTETVPAASSTDSLTDVLSIPSSATTTIEEADKKVGSLAHIEHAIANAIAQATGRPLPYPDEDLDYVPPGDPHIQDWAFPSLDPDDPDPGGSGEDSEEDRNRASDVADGIGVVAGLAGDIFDSASGFNLITTVGYSFVIFSAILGASHFFGALSGKQNDVRSHSPDRRNYTRRSSNNPEFKSDS